MAISQREKLRLWVKAGGRCTICKEYLLEAPNTAVEVPVGEAAHIVGREDTSRSPRGLDSLPKAERDLATNLMLACPNCHNEIDKPEVAKFLDASYLRQKKVEHENEILHQTGLSSDQRTTVIRMIGDIRKAPIALPRDTAIQTVLKSSNRFPKFLPSYYHDGVEIDLRQIPGEYDLPAPYYEICTKYIDQEIEQRIKPGIANGDIHHLSVFAIARLPLLVYLGFKLDDGVASDVYQRHRATENWCWPQDDADANFHTSLLHQRDSAHGVLITNLSGSTPVKDLPENLQDSTTWVLEPNTDPSEDLFIAPQVLQKFSDEVRRLFTRIETTHKSMDTLHVFGAMPLSAAVKFGMALKAPELRPKIVLYDRSPGGYTPALEV